MEFKQEQDVKESIPERNIRLLKEKKYDELYATNEKFIHYTVNKFSNVSDDKEELISLANFAFAKAIQTYDVSKEASFVSYLYLLISNEILMFYRKTKKKPDTISFDIITKEDARGHCLTLIDTIKSDINIEKDYENKELIEAIYEAIDYLKPSQKQVITLSLENHTQREIATITGFSQSYVSRLMIRAFEKIKTTINTPRRKTVMQTQKNAALIEKPKTVVVEAEPVTSPAKKKNLLVRNLTFETDSFFYMINNDQEANLNILPISSQDGFALDKIQAQNLIKDLNELITYL